jgi:hypothetical protein
MICVFLGCDDRPMVVGQTVESGKFREEGTVRGSLLGPIYLHGYIDGRAICEMEIGKLSSHIFRLS